MASDKTKAGSPKTETSKKERESVDNLDSLNPEVVKGSHKGKHDSQYGDKDNRTRVQ